MSLLGSIRSYITKKISNTIAGATFNEEAFDEAHSSPLKLRDIDDEDSTPTHDTDEEWTNLIKVKEGARGHDLVNLTDDFLIRESPTRLGQLRMRITAAALQKACEIPGVSAEYASAAIKYVATEAAHDVGWVTSCKTVMEAVEAVKERFPVLEDVKEAYKKGKEAAKGEMRLVQAWREGIDGEGVVAEGDVEDEEGWGVVEEKKKKKEKKILVEIREVEEEVEEYDADGEEEVDVEEDKFIGQK